MRTQRVKRSEPFWPSIVVKKWLNITPKVNDFSEDEIDTESEDDACSPKYKDRLMDRADHSQLKKYSSCSNSSTNGIASKNNSLKHKRGKSETLRLQYINTKEVRVTIGTWNVAGRLPSENLDLEEWLCTQEPAEMYILGFQEVVPLNAGNVLGAENRRPIPKWEAIIRQTLNRSLDAETKHKSYSAPPSPVLRTSSASDVLADVPVLDIIGKEPVNRISASDLETTNIGDKVLLNKIYGIDWDNRLDWPECSLESRSITSRDKLRRVMSNNARTGWGRGNDGFPSITQSALKRVHHSSGNLGLICMEPEDKLEVLDSLSDDVEQISGEEQGSFVEISDIRKESSQSRDSMKSRPRYVRIVSKQMVGIYVSIWVHRKLRRHINNLKVSQVGIGIMGYLGNKGSVSVSMSLFQSRLCFVCSHLTSGQKYGANERRNSDVNEILRRTHFSSVFDIDQPHMIPSHDQIFWFGDLNYRLNMLDEDVRKLVDKKQWYKLLNSDQLINEIRNGHVFDGWKEGTIDFAPTYKYEINSDRYVGESLKEGEKRRSPAWCDRILWFGKGIKQLSYNRAEIRLSDHRPVSSSFLVLVEIFDQRKLQKALNFSNSKVHPEIFFNEAQVEDH